MCLFINPFYTFPFSVFSFLYQISLRKIFSIPYNLISHMAYKIIRKFEIKEFTFNAICLR